MGKISLRCDLCGITLRRHDKRKWREGVIRVDSRFRRYSLKKRRAKYQKEKLNGE